MPTLTVPINENESIPLMEAITRLPTLRGCLALIMDQLDALLQTGLEAAFQGTDDSTRYVTAPLLAQEGPLHDSLLKARLLVALGKLEPEVFADIEHLTQLRQQLFNSPEEVGFTSAIALNGLASLHHFDSMLLQQFEMRMQNIPEEPELREQYIATLENSIRSALALAINAIAQKLITSS
ncbi:MltR family transcriptional regulator [Corallincola spongiicola]|uniref:MltR family transcriptional regulator n=1 Tax=Corallincola spongiicola TaxID=2520508 RepID=A0ABY1WPH6_9GAMM|nr:MltR family transcriptional regulator [Corallincola spongiicola]TAA45981.1 hypothetical protein EXY25_11585 [Corallincola spongiicola]